MLNVMKSIIFFMWTRWSRPTYLDNEDLFTWKPGIILCMRPANERRRYIVTSPLIGWVHTKIIPEKYVFISNCSFRSYRRVQFGQINRITVLSRRLLRVYHPISSILWRPFKEGIQPIWHYITFNIDSLSVINEMPYFRDSKHINRNEYVDPWTHKQWICKSLDI